MSLVGFSTYSTFTYLQRRSPAWASWLSETSKPTHGKQSLLLFVVFVNFEIPKCPVDRPRFSNILFSKKNRFILVLKSKEKKLDGQTIPNLCDRWHIWNSDDNLRWQRSSTWLVIAKIFLARLYLCGAYTNMAALYWALFVQNISTNIWS